MLTILGKAGLTKIVLVGSYKIEEFTTPFKVNQIFITAEDQANLTKPAGIEISRYSYNK